MNRDDVIRMAREAFIKRGFWPNEVMWECWKDAWIQGAAAEREACAKVCDNIAANHSLHDSNVSAGAAEDCAELIRARGQA